MKRNILYLVLTFFSSSLIFSQTARNFYPSTTGYKWFFKTTQLDENNQPITSLTIARIDSFATEENYWGRLSTIHLYKHGIDFLTAGLLPYYETLFNSFDGSIAYNILNSESIMDGDSIQTPALDFLINSVSGWYPIFNFATPLNNENVLFTKDTTVLFDGLNMLLRIELVSIRRPSELLTTEIGNFNCEKFDLVVRIKYKVVIVWVTLLEIVRTNWIADGQWILKTYRPTEVLDLTPYGGQKYILYGSVREIDDGNWTSIEKDVKLPKNFILYQNYPNPFNPTTVISYQIPIDSKVSLKISDMLGREVATLVDEEKSAGNYQVEFNSTDLSSGVYFYKLQVDNFSDVKKMIVLK